MDVSVAGLTLLLAYFHVLAVVEVYVVGQVMHFGHLSDLRHRVRRRHCCRVCMIWLSDPNPRTRQSFWISAVPSTGVPSSRTSLSGPAYLSIDL